MGNGGHKKMKIKVKKATGEIVDVQHENGDPADEMTEDEVEQMYQSPDGPKYIGTILFTHSSPECVVYYYGGKYRKVCW